MTENIVHNVSSCFQCFQSPGHFVLGFFEDVQVGGFKEFMRYINRVVKKNL